MGGKVWKTISLIPPDTTRSRNSTLASLENDDDEHGGCGDGVPSEEILEPGLEAFGFVTDESFCSAPSPLANHLLSTAAASDSVHQQQTPSSPASETESSMSSYATGTSSPVGASLSPNSSLIEKLGCLEKNCSNTPMEAKSTDFDRKSNSSVTVRRTATLGEVIMMSRRRSYRRKAVQTLRQNLPMEFMKNAVRCCIFGTNNGTRRLQRKWKRHIQLKLM